jgi:hypothetical protein
MKEKIMNNVFCFRTNWYDEWDDKDETTYGVVMAESYSDAVAKITKRFKYSRSIEINDMGDQDFVFIDEKVYEKIKSGKYEEGEYTIGE